MAELDYFWFPYCKDAYQPDWCRETMAELKASGDYFDVRIRASYYVEILVAHNPDAWDGDKLVECTFIDRREAIEKGLVKERMT